MKLEHDKTIDDYINAGEETVAELMNELKEQVVADLNSATLAANLANDDLFTPAAYLGLRHPRTSQVDGRGSRRGGGYVRASGDGACEKS